MDGFATTGAAFEYWFFNFRAGALSILIDFIVRRGPSSDGVEIRVSRWVRGIGTVERSVDPWREDPVAVVGSAAGTFKREGSVGNVGACNWDLSWKLGDRRLDPRPRVFGPFHPADLELITFPAARFDGWVTVGDERFDVSASPGAITHYWGRRLPDRWTWISATEFPGRPGRRVEALEAWSRTWGRGPSLPIGYLWTTDGLRDDLTISPVTGLIRVQRDRPAGGADLSISMSSLRLGGKSHRLHVYAPESVFNDLGEGIRQTLLADLTFDGLPAAPSSVGLELRIG